MECFFRISAYTLLCFGAAFNVQATTGDGSDFDTAEVVEFLGSLQDSQPSGLVPIHEGSTATTTYVNAVAAIAFTAEGELPRARRIFASFARHKDRCPGAGSSNEPCTCQGGYQQHRDAATGLPVDVDAPNDFWIGDNAWLLTAIRHYRAKAGDRRYDALIQRIRNWFICIERNTPQPGIFSGYTKDGSLLEFKHPEGSIDVFGSLGGQSQAKDLRRSILTWLTQEVWVPDEDCFRVGPLTDGNLPTDNVSWGVLARGSRYECLLKHAEALTWRALDPYTIEVFDLPVEGEVPRREASWVSEIRPGSSTVELAVGREQHGEGHDLVVSYSWDDSEEAWFRIYRRHDVDLAVTEAFRLFFWLYGNESLHRFEVKLQNRTGEIYIYTLPLDFSGWRKIEVAYDDFADFGDNQGVRLNEIAQFEFAANSEYLGVRRGAEDEEVRIGRVWYHLDGTSPFVPLDGFSGFESERNRIFVEGTGQMAAAYCVAGENEKWRHYLDVLTRLGQAMAEVGAAGLPGSLTGAVNQPVPEAAASSWYVIAARCLNPFDP